MHRDVKLRIYISSNNMNVSLIRCITYALVGNKFLQEHVSKYPKSETKVCVDHLESMTIFQQGSKMMKSRMNSREHCLME